ncbi:MAG TPA: hypothetical protein VK975_07110, partial [Acidimicrobiales bacterium]|nr:hypothetical protein [Acidimicrobiales bacterium]
MIRRERRDGSRINAAAPLLAVVGLGAALFGFVGPSGADVPAVTGSAYGYFTDVSLFGGASTTRGPDPAVTLPAEGSPVPVTATVPSAEAVYGPAVLFRSGPITVSTQGTTGAAGSATSSAHIVGFQDAADADPDPDGPGPFLYREITSGCTANEAGTTGSTTIVGGTLETKYDPDTQEPVETEPVPVNPPANSTRTGTIDHVGDSYRIVFNEHVANPDGSLTVNAAHLYLLGPTAVGEMIIGQSVCGVTTAPTTTTTTSTTSTTTTAPPAAAATAGTTPAEGPAATSLPGGPIA